MYFALRWTAFLLLASMTWSAVAQSAIKCSALLPPDNYIQRLQRQTIQREEDMIAELDQKMSRIRASEKWQAFSPDDIAAVSLQVKEFQNTHLENSSELRFAAVKSIVGILLKDSAIAKMSLLEVEAFAIQLAAEQHPIARHSNLPGLEVTMLLFKAEASRSRDLAIQLASASELIGKISNARNLLVLANLAASFAEARQVYSEWQLRNLHRRIVRDLTGLATPPKAFVTTWLQLALEYQNAADPFLEVMTQGMQDAQEKFYRLIDSDPFTAKFSEDSKRQIKVDWQYQSSAKNIETTLADLVVAENKEKAHLRDLIAVILKMVSDARGTL